MSLPVRWDPAREMMSMRQLMDRLMENAFVPAEGWNQRGGSSAEARMDLSETPEAYELKLAVPGTDPENLNITFENNTLTISGETHAEEEQQDTTYHVREIRYGSFSRSLTLPGNVNADQIEARCENGLLHLRIPKAEESKPRRIEVRGGGNGQTRQRELEQPAAQARGGRATKRS